MAKRSREWQSKRGIRIAAGRVLNLGLFIRRGEGREPKTSSTDVSCNVEEGTGQ